MANLKNMSAEELTLNTEFTRFDQYAPTQFDSKGLGADEDNADWLVVPMSYQGKISSLLDDSNWHSMLAALAEVDPDHKDHATHLFGHWTSDFEIVIVRPGSEAHRAAEQIAAALADYLVLDDEDYSERQTEQQFADVAEALGCLTVIDEDGSELELEYTDGSGLVLRVWEHMYEAGWSCLEETGQPGGGGVDRDDVERALEEMGYVQTECGVWQLSADDKDHSECVECSECGADGA